MRIIAGRAGGITIKAPPADTRPTSDRVREALFSMLGELVPGARVLDLFAGSGALGLEALSRGAREVCFVERHAAACAVIENNVRRAKLDGARVMQSEVAAALRRLAESGAQFDLIFADPPYAKQPGDTDFVTLLLEDENLPRVLAPGGWLLAGNDGDKARAPRHHRLACRARPRLRFHARAPSATLRPCRDS